MSQTPFYVSPEQLMKDRADFARKGIARGRSVVVLRYLDGILLLAENPSPTLHKIAEIYDRIGFAAVGKYNEFESLRQAGVRYADLRGYSYHRTDVTARGLTNAYAQTLAGVFTTESKPLEVELVVAELGETSEGDQLYRLSYDGSVSDEQEHVAIGGQADAITKTLGGLQTSVLSLQDVFNHGVRALAGVAGGTLPTEALEAAVLDRNASGHRTFKRLSDEAMAELREGWMARIYGLETEYGLAHTPTDNRRLGPEEIARYLFRPIVEWGRSSNVFLPNGSRLYLDVGSHPEYATAECDTLSDLLAQDRAGEALMIDLLAKAQSSLEADGLGGTIHMVKNNTDAAGNSYGSHENFLIRRNLDFNRLTTVLLPFLVSRQLLVGAGAIIPEKTAFHQDEKISGGRSVFGLSARSDVMWEGVSSATTRSRPIINARDEPHADNEKYRRLHVIVGDSSMSTATSALKIGSAVLMLDLIEQGARIPDHGLRHPVRDIRLVARDLTGSVSLERTDGTSITPLRLLADYRDRAAVIVDKGDHSLGEDGMADYVIDLWTRMLESVESQDFTPVEHEIDWVMKKALIDRALQRGISDLADPRIHRLDIAYHDITPTTGLFPKLEISGMARCLVPAEDRASAKEHPPETTRAAIRGAFVKAAHDARRDYTVDWVHLRLNDESGRAVALKDPFASHHPQATELIAGISSGL